MDLKAKRKQFNALLAANKMMDSKSHLLSGKGVESTLELSEKELDALIGYLRNIINPKHTTAPKQVREWRHKCLKMITECGVDTTNWEAVNAFMLDSRIAGKHMYELSVKELQNLHRKLHNVRDNKNKKKENVKRLTLQN